MMKIILFGAAYCDRHKGLIYDQYKMLKIFDNDASDLQAQLMTNNFIVFVRFIITNRYQSLKIKHV